MNDLSSNQGQFKAAIHNNNIEVVKVLLKDKSIKPEYNRNEAIAKSSAEGHHHIVKLLLNEPRVNPSDDHNVAIHKSALNGYIEVVKLLINDKRVTDVNVAITGASFRGQIDIVKLLLSHEKINPTYRNNKAIQDAIFNNHYHVVDLLWNDSRVKKTLEKAGELENVNLKNVNKAEHSAEMKKLNLGGGVPSLYSHTTNKKQIYTYYNDYE